MHGQRDVIMKYAENELRERADYKNSAEWDVWSAYAANALPAASLLRKYKNRQRNANGPSLKMHMDVFWLFFFGKSKL